MKFSRKILIFITVFSLLLSVSSITYASGLLRKITAYQNLGIQIEVDNKTVSMKSDGVELYPITFDGRTYVPAKPLAEALGASVKWDGANNRVIVNSGQGSTSTGSTSDNNSSSTSGVASTNKGTFSDPVKLGTAFTYFDEYNNKPDASYNYSAQYTVTLTKAVPISVSAIENLGIKVKSEEGISFMLVDVNVALKNAKFIQGTNSSFTFRHLADYYPNFSGVETSSNEFFSGVTINGFEGSLYKNILNALNGYPEIGVKDTGAYSASGSILVPIVQNKENYLMLKRSNTNLDYGDRHYYFKLK